MKKNIPMTPSLFDYQKKAVEKLETGSVLCGGVGSGKSRTAIAYYYNHTPPWCDLYIITTAQKRDSGDWEKEYALFRFTKPVVVDSWNNIQKYIHIKGAFFIFDEQRVIGSGKWVKSFLTITKKNDWILLSATPGDNWLDYVPLFIANGYFKNRSEFLAKHVKFKRFANYPIVESYINEERLALFRDSILVRMEYRKGAESVYIDLEVDHDEERIKMIKKSRKDPYTGLPVRTPAELIFLSRRIVNSDPSRLGNILALLEIHKKLIVFYNFDYELEILKTLSSSVPIGEWNGHKHEPIPTGESWIYLVQYMACEAWNCTETNALVFYSLNYSYRIMTQSAGRIDRLNTPFSKLYYYRLVSNSWIDRAVLEALKNKRNFNEAYLRRQLDVSSSRGKHGV